ncbi:MULTISPECIES: hypothetical protein [unclassified Meiothermus]|uniref:hypothetical protein n=1 Tax=unclassified Meiothermus TaxID=370471 RepID=UPI000D7C92E4|nr:MULTISPECIES: hypothetical protein [unclassified Meiothermus]PZA08810.1 hypothetical protein DNA98_01865 [Meiothermus sp. Pnk-1]RYM40567.1 hypothetical protein EWH23_00075 [Meiothermus sp. PNK-Is4]
MRSLERLLTALALMLLTLGPGPALAHPGPTRKEKVGAWSVTPPPQLGEASGKLAGLQSAGAIPALSESARQAAALVLALAPAQSARGFFASRLYLHYCHLQLEGG